MSAFKILGRRTNRIISEIDAIQIIQKGFTKKHLLNLKQKNGFTFQQIAVMISTSTRSIEQMDANTTLRNTVSERLFKIAEVLAVGKKVLGKQQELTQWLRRPLLPLDGVRPLDLMVNFYGLNLVKTLLGRINHETYS